MSFWTHIVGVIHVNTYRETKDIQQYVEQALADAPKITGSEFDADVFVNIKSRHNVTTAKCLSEIGCEHFGGHCEGGFHCNYEGPYNVEMCYTEFQTVVVITVCGDLRDRSLKQTKKEWHEFHRYIAKKLKWDIINASCRIEGV